MLSSSFNTTFLHFIDIGVVVGTGLASTILLVRLVAQPIAARAPTQANAVKLLLQLVGLAVIAVVVLLLTGTTGTSLVSTLVGVGFFGIVLGLAAQEVLGNLFSGLMLLAARPFNINDRIALVAWQFGKFPPSTSHGWLEPAYSGVVKGISLTYTRILTDSNAMLKVPNRLVTQALIMNLSHGRQGHIAAQFEAPIDLDPDDLRKRLKAQLSKTNEFKGEEESFEVLEVSPSAYLVAVSYEVEKQTEMRSKDLLLRAVRQALVRSSDKTADKEAK